MIAADHHRRFDLSRLYQVVDALAKRSALAVTEPADPRGQTLESDFLASEMDPAAQNFVFGKQFEHQVVGNRDVSRVSRKRCPAEGPAAFGKHRTNVGRN